ncbi:MaoC family dehydratase [Calidifontibacter sp. DB0510]|uniref:MaoC family dehydratase n=1 Tax=Metallococcus carri TaxID=1656884 RepID=A0A967E9I4_9MICO|nr:MaoC family dehydratase [Metallococcus carri]NHN55230.1 MaoC family dehydratase [Metallococcus carri]NOP36307.1 MaoC family dehydratase [Calidifontibacter sp. DB2511S]
MKVFNGIDEIQAAVGEHLGYSSWHEITQEQVDTFADATGDHQWIHVDVDKAKAGPFGGTIAHGYLTLSMVPMLVWEIYKVEGISMGINYGSNKVRFPAPVPVGSKVRAGVEVGSVESGPKGAQCTMKVTVEIEGSDRPALVAETITLIVP